MSYTIKSYTIFLYLLIIIYGIYKNKLFNMCRYHLVIVISKINMLSIL